MGYPFLLKVSSNVKDIVFTDSKQRLDCSFCVSVDNGSLGALRCGTSELVPVFTLLANRQRLMRLCVVFQGSCCFSSCCRTKLVRSMAEDDDEIPEELPVEMREEGHFFDFIDFYRKAEFCDRAIRLEIMEEGKKGEP
ncbi:hypothetical protein KFL_002110230 [Klebsormidium nitens]|uniref:Uncharacterized protein n=1 Tax=Klebsormidium nitens TaxID=105231 RepID=A0A1Y1I1V6_KLENI|nr:hypothetical protein KFL_002110230 [Klebsormidium nitens]|eukprot:GAQ84905.1 hypothetical protein KFL_002110230 [Klebsormidium nitens]